MSELKLRRLIEHNQRLREDLARPRVRVSEASARCVPTRVILSPTGADMAPQRPQSHPILQNHQGPPRSCLLLHTFLSVFADVRFREPSRCLLFGAPSAEQRILTANRLQGNAASFSDRPIGNDYTTSPPLAARTASCYGAPLYLGMDM